MSTILFSGTVCWPHVILSFGDDRCRDANVMYDIAVSSMYMVG
jgi:hypothetical protein